MQVFYRYSTHFVSSGLDESEIFSSGSTQKLNLEKYFLIKETNKSWCVVSEWEFNDQSEEFLGKVLTFNPKKHWIKKSSRKKFAYPTIEAAANSFLIRKKRQVGILEKQLEYAKVALAMANEEVGKLNKKQT